MTRHDLTLVSEDKDSKMESMRSPLPRKGSLHSHEFDLPSIEKVGLNLNLHKSVESIASERAKNFTEPLDQMSRNKVKEMMMQDVMV